MAGRGGTFLSVMMASWRKYHTSEAFTKNDFETKYQLFMSWISIRKIIVPQQHINIEHYIYNA